MKLYVYRARMANFGDELNEWLLPKIFPNFFDNAPDPLFLGIGSILFNHHPKDVRKIVFGSGYGGYTATPVFDDNWSIYCVRGPRTAAMCGIGEDRVSGDTAILIGCHRPAPPKKTVRFGFIPHWESVERGNWPKVCALTGIRYIDPTRSVDEVLEDLESCDVVIAEAMHGAIVADALRIPWIPVLPFDTAHHNKWLDWSEALGIHLRPHRIAPSSTREMVLSHLQREASRLKRPRGLFKVGVKGLDSILIQEAARRLDRLSRAEPQLSADSAIADCVDRLESFAAQIRRDFDGASVATIRTDATGVDRISDPSP